MAQAIARGRTTSSARRACRAWENAQEQGAHAAAALSVRRAVRTGPVVGPTVRPQIQLATLRGRREGKSSRFRRRAPLVALYGRADGWSACRQNRPRPGWISQLIADGASWRSPRALRPAQRPRGPKNTFVAIAPKWMAKTRGHDLTICSDKPQESRGPIQRSVRNARSRREALLKASRTGSNAWSFEAVPRSAVPAFTSAASRRRKERGDDSSRYPAAVERRESGRRGDLVGLRLDTHTAVKVGWQGGATAPRKAARCCARARRACR